MANRLRKLGVVLALAGVGFIVLGGIAWTQVQDGYDALGSFSEAQNVTLSYNEDGELVDRGTVEGAQAIKTMLTEDWGFNVIESDLNPDDPLVNTATEYMFQMATIGYHILHGTQTVVLAEDAFYDTDGDGVDEVFPAGTYEFDVDGRYWTDFDRRHPIQGPAREQAWNGTAHGLFAELGVGTVTHSALQIGMAVAGIVAALGGTLLIAGLGLIWASRGDEFEPKFEMVMPETKEPEPTPVG
jgi:hypothetical protein